MSYKLISIHAFSMGIPIMDCTVLLQVDLSVNRMSTVDRNWLRVHPELPNLPKFLLGGNPIECDCEMVWLKTVNEKAELQVEPAHSL